MCSLFEELVLSEFVCSVCGCHFFAEVPSSYLPIDDDDYFSGICDFCEFEI